MTITASFPSPMRPLSGLSLGRTVVSWLLDVFRMHLDLWPWVGMDSNSAAARINQRMTPPDINDSTPPDPYQSKVTAYHEPVLMQEVLKFLEPGPGKLILDGTLGGGGHTERILQAGAKVIALDQDSEALAFATARLRSFHGQLITIQANFRQFAEILSEAGITGVDGILVDLGVSSHQLDDPTRGFSFQKDGPLDMRMNAEAGRSAADFVNEESAEELARIFYEYGEEKASRRIARAIVERRAKTPFTTTAELADCVASVVPKFGKRHPATKVFQALRIAVNDELGALADLLAQAPRWLKPGGRLVIISFHSLEDRLVKQAFARLSTEWLDRPEWPEPRRNPDHCLKLLTRKPAEATEEELARNPRSRSARLRAAEKLPKP